MAASRSTQKLLQARHSEAPLTREVASQIKTEVPTMATGAVEESVEVLLFVRIEGEPYTCLGRVQYVDVDLMALPIAFRMHLLDFHTLKKEEYFQRILKIALLG
jgi:hypothetical protein